AGRNHDGNDEPLVVGGFVARDNREILAAATTVRDVAQGGRLDQQRDAAVVIAALHLDRYFALVDQREGVFLAELDAVRCAPFNLEAGPGRFLLLQLLGQVLEPIVHLAVVAGGHHGDDGHLDFFFGPERDTEPERQRGGQGKRERYSEDSQQHGNTP